MEIISYYKKIVHILTKDERKFLLLLFVMMLIGMLFETVGIAIVVPVVGVLVQGDYLEKFPWLQPYLERIGNPEQQTLIIIVMCLLIIFYLIKDGYLSFLAWTQNKFAARILSSVSTRLFSLYVNQPYLFHIRNNSAQLIRNVLNEASAFGLYGISSGLILLTEVTVLIGTLLLLIIFYPVITLSAIALFGFVGAVYFYITKVKLLNWGKQRQYFEGMRLKHVQQGLGGIKDVKLTGYEKYFINKFKYYTYETNNIGKKQSTISQLPRFIMEFIMITAIAILVIVIMLKENSTNNIMPILTLFGMASFRLMPAITRILTASQNLKFGTPIVDLLYHDLTKIKTVKFKNELDKEKKIPFNNSIVAKNIKFKYDKDNDILKGISLQINKGQTVGFIGESGAGKSTFADILLGLLEPYEGKIEVDGKDIFNNVHAWQKNIGYVPQSIFLTDDTLRRNIAFGVEDEDISDEKVWESLRMAQLDEFVKTLSEGLDTFVGERGVKLSGGQRQRIGIARALYNNPSVLLLDEATSALDVQTEEKFIDTIKNLHGDKTIIIIAHRLSTVEHCDVIFKFNNGNIESSGIPKEVIYCERSI